MTIMKIAAREGRDYATPEDVSESLEEEKANMVRCELLKIIAGHHPTLRYAEDTDLCAYIAWRGIPSKKDQS